MSERELVLKAKNGSVDAFCLLYGKYKSKLYSYAFYKLGNASDAEDAVQNCMLSAFEQVDKLKKTEAFSSWIFRILYCSCSALIKEQIRQRNTDDLDDYTNIASSDNKFVLQEELRQALNILSDEERNIVLLSAVAGFKSKEIAQITGLSAGNVRTKLSRSLKKMKEYLS